MSAEVAAWVRHYASGYFTRAALEAQLRELEHGRRQFAYGKRDEAGARRQALAQLLRGPFADPP